MRERDIERHLIRRAAEHGYLLRKLRWTGRNGAPDRLLLGPRGKVVWVELKAPGAAPEGHQLREHIRMRVLGQDVRVVDSIEQVEGLFG